MTGAERADELLAFKEIANTKTYANLPPVVDSRQVQRRFIRQQAKRAMRQVKADVIKGRR